MPIIFKPTLFVRSLEIIDHSTTIEHVSRPDTQKCAGRADESNREDRVQRSASSIFLAREAVEMQT